MAPLLLLRLAQCNLKQGKWEEGNKYLARLRNEFPSSMEAQMSEPLSSTDEFFCVQAGSFTDQDNAEAFAADLRKEGYDAYVSGVSVDNKTLFRVRVGECETRTEAEELKARMDASGYDSKIYP
jgi:cell division septation protein DedD